MPEIKHNFTGGRMNKDLDARLVPNGEYRDAMNIQVRTTDGGEDGLGDSGTVQNIRGNKQILSSVNSQLDKNDDTNKTTVVGSIANEKNNKAYFFVSGCDFNKIANDFPEDEIVVVADTIMEVDIQDGTNPPITSPVVVDKYGVITRYRGMIRYMDDQTQSGTTYTNVVQLWMRKAITQHLRPGMIFATRDSTQYSSPGINIGSSALAMSNPDASIKGEIHSILDPSTEAEISVYGDAAFPNGANQEEDIWEEMGFQKVLFTNPFNFTPANISHISFENKQGRALNFNYKRKISAISIIDDFLFWTDAYEENGKIIGNEPKRINIQKCKEGTSAYTKHTKLTLRDPESPSNYIPYTDLENSLGTDANNYIEEKHVTVVRQAPRTAPTLEMYSSTRAGKTSVVGISKDFQMSYEDFGEGSTVNIEDTELVGLDWQINDVLIFTENVFDVENRAVIRATINEYDPADTDGNIQLIILSVSTNYTAANEDILGSGTWRIDLQDRNPLFELKMGRFGYRYKYDDGEYSTFSPWSELAFLPGKFDYNNKKGYNLGMVNTVRRLVVKGFIPHQMNRPQDVVSVDILWKTTESPNVYIVKTIERKRDAEWNLFSVDSIFSSDTAIANAPWNFGKLNVTSEMIFRVVEKNQLLRAWDNVPRKALAQEIAANRVVFGNYVQGYTIKKKPNLEQNLISYNDASLGGPKKSVKSIRNYKFGMVFGDKYGRETPVIIGSQTSGDNAINSISSTGDVFVDKEFSKMRNTFKLKQMWDQEGTAEFQAPENWMEYVKYYVKETSNEYYNLIMDRWYEAEDGNIWISFASADRNKVDEETYLILKKQHGTQQAVISKSRYKVLAIKNEPPDFIKIDPRLMGRVQLVTADLTAISNDNDPFDGEFGVFSSDAGGSGADTTTVAPDLLMKNKSILLNQWNDFLKDYEPKGDLQVRIVGLGNGGDADGIRIEGDIWRTVTYHGVMNDSGGGATNAGIVRWNEPFGISANMANRFSSAGYNPASIRYSLEFRENVVVHSAAQFEGKFFVKLERDDVLESKVLGTQASGGYYNTTSWRVAYIDSAKEHPSESNVVDGVELHPRYQYQWFKTDTSDTTGLANVLGDTTDPDSDNNIASGNVANPNEAAGWDTIESDSGVNQQDGGDYISLGCDEGDDSSGYTIADAIGFSGYSIVNFAQYTRAFWRWRHSYTPGVLQSNMFIDSARGKFINFSGPTQPTDGRNNDGGEGEENQILRDSYYYKPTGLDAGYQISQGVEPTVAGHFGRICISINHGNQTLGESQWGGWSEISQTHEEAAFRSWMTTTGNKFRFSKDPDPSNIYQIVSISPDVIDNNGNGAGKNFSKMVNSGGNNFQMSEYTTKFFNHPDDDATTDLITAQDYDENEFPSLNNILIGGGITFTEGDVLSCGDCNADDEYCLRDSFRVEFRKYNMATGQVIPNEGLDFTDWDPRGTICHDGRETLEILAVGALQRDSALSGNTTTPDPACFETEPKEDVGLDLYYEASHAIPMVLRENNISDFIPYNSKVSLKVGPNAENDSSFSYGVLHRVFQLHQGKQGNYEKYMVVGIEFNDTVDITAEATLTQSTITYKPYTPGASTLFSSNDSNLNYSYNNPKWLVFEHDNGVKTMAKIEGHVWPVDENDVFIEVEVDASTGDYVFPGQGPSSSFRFRERRDDNNAPMQSGFILINPLVYKNAIELAWHNCWSFGNGIESDRIRDDYNAPRLDNGVKVSTTFLDYKEEHKGSGMIYSGIYNSISSVNNLNEFNQAEKITKDINPSYGSIQALKTRDTDIVVFTEDKLLKVMTNKDALFNADGNAQLTATNRVLGTAMPFAGDYGISKNPESLTWDSFRMYFTDMQRGAVLRLSGDGLTPISNVGMKTWFRENLRQCDTLLGTFDTVNGEYNLTLNYINSEIPNKTVSFNEASKGWVSFKSFIPEAGVSIGGKYITGKHIEPTIPSNVSEDQKSFTLWEHHSNIRSSSGLNEGEVINRNTFYAPEGFVRAGLVDDYFAESHIDVLFNDMPGQVKSFTNVFYEGSQARIQQFTYEEMPDIENPENDPLSLSDGEYYNLSPEDGWWVSNIITDQSLKGSVREFKGKEGKWYNKVDGLNRDNITKKDLNEFSVQGIGSLQSLDSSIGTSTNVTESISDDGLTVTVTTTDIVDDGTNETTTTTTEVTTTNEEDGTTTTTTTETTDTQPSGTFYFNVEANSNDGAITYNSSAWGDIYEPLFPEQTLEEWLDQFSEEE